MLLVIVCALVVFGLPLLLAASTRLVVTGASEFRARVMETVAAAVQRGLAVDPQLLWLIAHDVRGRRSRAVRRAARELDEGTSLAVALAGALRLPPEDAAAIAAAEGTERLADTLRETANADRRRFAFRHQLLIRLAYPALILAFLGGFLGIGIAPKFHDVCASLDVVTGNFLTVFEVARVVGLGLAAVTAVVAVAGFGFARPLGSLVARWRTTATASRTEGWLRALSTAIRAGRPFDEALERTAGALGHEPHAARVREAALRCRDGADVPTVWNELPVAGWLRARGPLLAGPPSALAAALLELADAAGDRAHAARDRVLLVLGPLLLGVTGLVVGAVFFQLFAMLQRLREATLW